MMLSIGYVGPLIGPWFAGYLMDTTGTLDSALIFLAGVSVAWACIAFFVPETGSRARKSLGV